MKEILDIVVWVGIAFVLFIFLRGMNETQTAKHKARLDKAEDEAKNIKKGQK